MNFALDDLEEALCSNEGQSIVRTLARLGTGTPLDEEDLNNVPLLIELGVGIQTARGFKLGQLGYKCADAAREYTFWVERDRRIHEEDQFPVLVLRNFREERVLELGSGWGCNLFRLQQVTPHARDCEIDPVYRRFTSILARIEGVDPPKIDPGAGEQLPYEDESFDWVLMFSALQYMDVRRAVREAARVLRPGGILVSTQPLLPELFLDARRAIGKPGVLAHSLAMSRSMHKLLGCLRTATRMKLINTASGALSAHTCQRLVLVTAFWPISRHVVSSAPTTG